MMSLALEMLRRNDPQQTRVEIRLDEEDDAAIAQALEQNQYVSHIRLNLGQRNTDWNHLHQVLATRRNLVQFVLLCIPSIPGGRIRPILQAIQQNASVRVVEYFHNTWEAEDLCSFLDAAVHITDLALVRCDLTGGEQGARDVTAVLQRNINIKTLTLCSVGPFLDTVLEGLISNTCLKKLVIGDVFLAEASTRNALRVLLESTRSIQHLKLVGTRGESFRVVAHGLIDSSTVTDITLKYCSFQDEGSMGLLNQIFERKQNLHTLAIKGCAFYSQWPQLHQALFSALRRDDSPLRHFRFEDMHHVPNDSIQSFRSLCQAVAESKLETFSIGIVDTLSRSQTLADALPSMKIREIVIQFGFFGLNETDRMEQTVCRAVKNNFTLQSVKHQHGSAEPFDPTDEDGTLKFCLERNIRLAKWVENPATVPKHLWKEATTLATKAGPDVLFQLLRKIGPEVLPVRGRKRKRSG